MPAEKRSVWTEQLRSLALELEAKQLSYQEAARAYLTQLLVESARLAAAEREPFSRPDQSLLAEVFEFINRRFTESISLAAVAAAVKRSPAYLTTLARRSTGRTVLSYKGMLWVFMFLGFSVTLIQCRLRSPLLLSAMLPCLLGMPSDRLPKYARTPEQAALYRGSIGVNNGQAMQSEERCRETSFE